MSPVLLAHLFEQVSYTQGMETVIRLKEIRFNLLEGGGADRAPPCQPHLGC